MSIFGEEIKLLAEWDHLEFYLIPNYIDALNESFDDFKEFKTLFHSITKIQNS